MVMIIQYLYMVVVQQYYKCLFQEKKDFPKFPGFFTGWDIADTMRDYELEDE